MHYIRLLAPVRLQGSSLAVKLTINGENGDQRLSPDAPIRLALILDNGAAQTQTLVHDSLLWTAGARALEAVVPLPTRLDEAGRDGLRVRVALAPANLARRLRLPSLGGKPVRIFPVSTRVGERVQHRALPGAGESWIEVGEDIVEEEDILEEEGAGRAAPPRVRDADTCVLALLAELAAADRADASSPPSRMPVLAGPIMSGGGAPVSVLELGCGVGAIGLGLACLLLDSGRAVGQILITDHPEAAAEARARANVGLVTEEINKRSSSSSSRNGGDIAVKYENLDWSAVTDADSLPAAVKAGAPWDLVLLGDCASGGRRGRVAELVGVMGALHAANAARKPGQAASTHVLLAAKTALDPEKKQQQQPTALFDMMAREGWAMVERADLLVDGAVGPEGEEQVVGVVLYKKEG